MFYQQDEVYKLFKNNYSYTNHQHVRLDLLVQLAYSD